MSQFIIFSFLTYGLAFLLADAKIFGRPVNDQTDESGIIPLRQHLLKINFVQKLLTCYYCLGVWCGAIVFWIIVLAREYFTVSLSGIGDYVAGTVLSAILGGPVCYAIDLMMQALENIVSPPDKI